MNTHTPGPWFTSQPHQTIYIEARIGGGMLQEIGAIGPTEGGPFQQAANARLIAAAPELMEALKACLQCFYEMTGRKPAFVEDSIAMGKEALTKATGEQP